MAANAIRIPIVVDTTTGTAQVKTFAKTTETTLTNTANKVKPALGKVETQTASLGKKFKGAEGAISGMGASLQLVGTQGPPALQTLTTSFVSMLSAGVTPLTLALAGGVGLISLISALGDETEETADKFNPLIRQGTELTRVLDGLADRVQKLRLFERGAQSGLGTDRQGLIESREAAQRRLRGPAGELRGINRFFGRLPGLRREVERAYTGEALGEQRQRLEIEADRLQARREVLGEIIRRDTGIIAHVNEILAGMGRGAGGSPGGGRGGRGGGALSGAISGAARLNAIREARAGLPNPFDPIDFGGNAAAALGIGGRDSRAAKFAREAHQERVDLENALRDIERQNERERLEAAIELMRERQQSNLDELRALEERRLAEIQAEERLSLARGDRFAGGLSGTLQQAINSADFSTFGQNMAAVVRDSLTAALSDAFIEATGVKDAAAQGFGAIRGAFNLGPSATGN